MFTIDIKKSTAEEAVQNQNVWTLEISCTSTDQDVTNKIFLFHKAADGLDGHVFAAVASVTNLVNYPADSAPDGVSFFRLDTVTAYCASAQERLELEQGILDDIEDLKENIEAARQLDLDKTVTV